MSFSLTGVGNSYYSATDYMSGIGGKADSRSPDETTGLPGRAKQDGTQAVQKTGTGNGKDSGRTDPRLTAPNGEPLTEEQADQVRELKKRDTEVRAHEQAHLAAGGQYARSGASYKFTTGPDGAQYATGGEVSIDTSPVADDPEATIRKMEVVKAAANAPARPSGQDYSVAANAESAANEARQEMQRQAASKYGFNGSGKSSPKGASLDKTI